MLRVVVGNSFRWQVKSGVAPFRQMATRTKLGSGLPLSGASLLPQRRKELIEDRFLR